MLQCLSGYLAISAALLQSDDPRFCSGWNIGPTPGGELPVQEVVEAFLREWGCGTWVDASDPHQPHEAAMLYLSIDKAMRELNWKPCWDTEQALCQTAAWYRDFLNDPAAARELCLEQIAAYEGVMNQSTRRRSAQFSAVS